MKFHWKNGWIAMSLFAVFFLAACGGGSDSSAPPRPVVVTDNATGITNVGATLNGTVNPNGRDTEAWFEWGTSATMATFDNTAKQAFAAGTTVQSVSASISGLTFDNTYYFRIVASNSSGVSKGTIGNFSTAAQRPTVTTLAADNVLATSATLNGGVNPNFLDTLAWFEYGTDNSLATFSKTADVGIGSGSAVVGTSANITGLVLTGTVYFRAAASNGAGEQKGDILTIDTNSLVPVADAGPDNTVDMGQTVTLDGSGSTTPIGTITSYLWTQVNGTPVALVDNNTETPTFTAPTVARIGEVLRFQLAVTDSRSLTASDNVDIIVKWVGFADDFSTNTLDNYTFTTTSGTGGTESWTGDSLQLDIGDNNGLEFSPKLPLPAGDNGVFSLDFTPTVAYPSHGGIWIRLVDLSNPTNYYEISNFDWGAGTPTPPDIAAVKKFVGDVAVDTVAIPTAYVQGNTYNIKITFGRNQVVVEGFGAPVMLNPTDPTIISVTGFEVDSGQQDAYYDNIKLVAHP